MPRPDPIAPAPAARPVLSRRIGGASALLTVLLLATASCGGSDDAGSASGRGTGDRAPTSTTTSTTETPATTEPATAVVPSSAAPSTEAPTTTVPSTVPPSTTPATTAGPNAGLAGKTILVDPGHNGGNASHPSEINKQVFVGNASKACDTTGTATDGGYSEAEYTFDVAQRLQALLVAAGAEVVMTRTDNSGVGPCITERAGLGNLAGADLAISIHADGSAASNRGFHVIEPLAVPGYNDGIVAPSRLFGRILADTYAAGTGVPPANYVGTNGEIQRSDLGGLNLSKVPKVFIETGNMRSPVDAALLTDAAFRQKAAQAIADAMALYFRG